MKLKSLYPLLLVVLFLSNSYATGHYPEPKSYFQQASIAQDVDARQFRKLAKKKNVVLIDVRTPEEYEEGHIKGARNIDYRDSDFRSNIDLLAKDTPVLVYCRSDRRSGQAMELMRELGFKTIYNLDGGILAWTAEEFPIEE